MMRNRLALYMAGALLVFLLVVSFEGSCAKIDTKPGVRVYGLNIKMRHVLIEAADIWDDYGKTVVLTSVTDSIHSPGSLHYYGYAVDFRTRYFTRKQAYGVYQELKSRIDSCFIVLLESNHIHVHAGEACRD